VNTRIVPKLKECRDPLTLRVSDFKKSDTLFIMGSGTSIHDLPSEAWQMIWNSDSLGINFWLYHEHVPTWHFCEVSREPAEAESLMALLRMRIEDYRGTCLLLKDVMRLDERFPRWNTEFPLGEANNLHTLASLGVRGRTEWSLRFFLRWYRRLGYFKGGEVLWGLPMKRATIFMTLSFALMAGYRRVVLCGVDMSNTDYFYHHPKYAVEGMPKPPTLPGTSQGLAEKYSGHGVKMRQAPNPAIHNTIDPALNPLPMDAVIHALNDEVLKPEGVELFVALPSSKLHPVIPALFKPLNPA
jgi:hypothetical protein